MDELLSIQRDILYVIAGLTEPIGTEIKDQLDEYYGTNLNPARLYPNLDELVEKGFVTKDRATKRSNAYTLTDRAYREFKARREWESRHVAELLSDDD